MIRKSSQKTCAADQDQSGQMVSPIPSSETTPSVVEMKSSNMEDGRKRRGSGVDRKPPRLPDIGEQGAVSPLVHKPPSAPLSPLPLIPGKTFLAFKNKIVFRVEKR